MLVRKECINMEEKIVRIVNAMAEFLSIEQLKKLQEVIVQELSENEPQRENISNDEYITRFLNAKQMEGCSDRTIQYYRVTVEHFLKDISNPVRKISTEQIRNYLVRYQNLMKYIPRGKIKYETNFSDELLSVEWKESELENDELKNYKAKAEYYIRQHQDNAAIIKLKTNQPLTETDVETLEAILWKEVGTKQDYEHEVGAKPLGEFVREIVGLDMNAAKEAFSEYLTSTSLDSRQIYFVNQIVEYIVHNGMMKDLSVLQESPFTDQGSVVEIFTDLTVWMGIRKVIETINANAAA